MEIDPFIFRLSIFILSIFIGYYVVWSVTPSLHTPLMSVTNAISSVIIVGAIIAGLAGNSESIFNTSSIFGFLAISLAAINIFGGLARTDIIAEGFVQAKKSGLTNQSTVIRLAGTNVEDGKKILIESGIEYKLADGFAEGANLAVKASKN